MTDLAFEMSRLWYPDVWGTIVEHQIFKYQRKATWSRLDRLYKRNGRTKLMSTRTRCVVCMGRGRVTVRARCRAARPSQMICGRCKGTGKVDIYRD